MRISDWSSDVCSSDLSSVPIASNAYSTGHARTSRPPAQDFDLCSGLPLRLVWAMRSSSSSLIDSYISFEGPFSSLFIFSPRLAASATPAACCCALDFAGMAMLLPQCSQDLGYALHRNVAALCPVPVPGTVRGTAQNPRGEPPGEIGSAHV